MGTRNWEEYVPLLRPHPMSAGVSDVIFYFSRRTLKFSKDGVQEFDLNNFPYHTIYSPIWCLIDSFGGERPPLPLIGACMFPILASHGRTSHIPAGPKGSALLGSL